MAETCGLKCVKYILFVFNIVIWLAGAAVLAVGIWIHVQKDSSTGRLDRLVGSDLPLVSWILIGAGSFVFIVGFSGCCGAIRESKCLLGLYFSLLLLVFAAEVAASVLAYLFYDEAKLMLEKQVNSTIKNNYGDPNYLAITIAVDLMQTQFSCCGDKDYTAWKGTVYYTDAKYQSTTNGTLVPKSCCIDPEEPDCNSNADQSVAYLEQHIHLTGCQTKLEDWVRDNLLIVGGVALGIAMVQIIAIIFACCLFCSVKNNRVVRL